MQQNTILVGSAMAACRVHLGMTHSLGQLGGCT